jgi:hypothetical protein
MKQKQVAFAVLVLAAAAAMYAIQPGHDQAYHL